MNGGVGHHRETRRMKAAGETDSVCARLHLHVKPILPDKFGACITREPVKPVGTES